MTVSKARSLFGGPLIGEHSRVHIYCDEAGTSQNEDFAVVAAVIVNPYQQVQEVERAIASAIESVIPEDAREGFIFHAKDVRNNRRWGNKEAFQIIARWLDIFAEVGVPIVVSWWNKSAGSRIGFSVPPPVKKGRKKYPKSENKIAHMAAFKRCLSEADRVIETFYPDDIATVFAEDCVEMRKVLADFVRDVQGAEMQSDFINRKHTKIRNGISWVSKEDCMSIQLADAVAFTFQRYLNRASYGDFLKWVLAGRPDYTLTKDWTTSNGGSLVLLPGVRG